MADVSRAGKILITAVCGVLGACYLAALYLALNPNVSDDYRRYYIERSTKLTVFQEGKVARGLHEPVARLAFNDPAAGFNGWHPPQGSDRWSTGQRWSIGHTASVDFRLPAACNPKGVVAVFASYFRLEPRRIRIYLNGTAIVTYSPLENPWNLLVDMDSSLLKRGQSNSLTFQITDAGNGDLPGLAMALEAVEIY
jgi:hypothetical protein